MCGRIHPASVRSQCRQLTLMIPHQCTRHEHSAARCHCSSLSPQHTVIYITPSCTLHDCCSLAALCSLCWHVYFHMCWLYNTPRCSSWTDAKQAAGSWLDVSSCAEMGMLTLLVALLPWLATKMTAIRSAGRRCRQQAQLHGRRRPA